ncbi:hypothetical protein BDV36DRAFT_260185 [Aspergillus pseudocaelatus]|uniref:Uncharacterized protein n=1 Tax=Aspergillus pseudocaelatus TaxID=1825620 RepID=A0ABQ6WLT5_9EURO|nr:hypothetical protein BDV36DRAFT_260185 [Aspergillus pseudocaelatus]
MILARRELPSSTMLASIGSWLLQEYLLPREKTSTRKAGNTVNALQGVSFEGYQEIVKL